MRSKGLFTVFKLKNRLNLALTPSRGQCVHAATAHFTEARLKYGVGSRPQIGATGPDRSQIVLIAQCVHREDITLKHTKTLNVAIAYTGQAILSGHFLQCFGHTDAGRHTRRTAARA